MSSFLNVLRAGPPPPRVVLLPDGLFFVRAVPVAGGADAAEVASQVDLALEAAAPFPLEQLYHGHYWLPGSEHALAFAAYRRRFTQEQLEPWSEAALVLPAFAAVLGAAPAPATTAVLAAPQGFTAVRWESGPVPSAVAFQPVPPDASDEDRAQAREALLRRFESEAVADLPAAPVPESGGVDQETAFRSGDWVSRFPSETVSALDVRDKEVLAGIRGARRRDLMLWRVGIGCLAACAALALGELALAGAGLWQKSRIVLLKAQAPTVERIKTSNDLAKYIQDLSTKRLLPLEMISVASVPKPASVQFLSAVAGGGGGLYTLSVEAQTTNAGDVSGYQSALQALPAVASAEVKITNTRNNVASLTLVITFKPAALKPAAPVS